MRRASLRLALVPLALVLPDLGLGDPSPARFAAAALGCLAVAASLRWADPLSRLLRKRGLGLVVALVAIAWSALALAPIQNGVDVRLGQDTAYFTQIVYKASQGEAPRGDVVNAVLYHPPLRSHFGAHFSPIVYALAPLFWLLPGWRTLALARTLVLFASGLVVWRWVRDRAPAPWPALAALLLLILPPIWVQAMHAVYLLPMAIPFALLLWLGGLDRRRSWILVGILGLMLVREDALLLASLGGALVLLTQRRWLPALSIGAVGVIWYGMSAALIMPAFGEASGEAVGGLFAGYGGITGLISRPWIVLERLLSVESLRAAWSMIRATGGLALLNPLSLAGLPSHTVNALAAGQGFGTLELDYHYSLLASSAVGVGGIAALVARRADSMSVRLPWAGQVPLTSIVVLWMTGSGLSTLDTVDRERLAGFRAPDHASWIHARIAEFPRRWRVAAPRPYLPHLALHDQVYMVNRLADYPDPTPDAWLVTEDVESLQLRDGTRAAYEELLSRLSTDPDVVLVDRSGPWRLYLRAEHAGDFGSPGASSSPQPPREREP